MAMNKKYDRTDQERDQTRQLEQAEAERKKAQQAGDGPRRQHGGWTEEEKNRDGSKRDGDSGEKLVDEP
jgi:hypothetical protein